ncbi:RAD55 family ATPase [Pyrobaculum neutrophilum]|uniref:KaiC-like domain-containing protein n=1 Tax=Pyrobaculum neutrophilum (strain DSM 2338 / JCM 9278 / NBRC 100436 / V24Sta) TaxID=444157 RepID=B1YCS5_PYRNV|nr:RAD55 family ATPase [Pyrobaculum neutrophilum]ACB39588.1 conserved hypothetical protein [Pyrobaculum neutrophilum V24Sta]
MDLRRVFAERVSFVYGASGSGKTVLVSKVAFDFAKEGRRVVWVTFNEGKDTLYETWKSFGWRAEDVVVFDYPFVPQYRETLFNQVVDLAYKERADVFVVDGIEAIVFDRASADALTKIGLYSVIGIEAKYNPLADIADVIVKMEARYTDHGTIRRIKIEKARGIEVLKPIYYLAILPTGPVVLTNEFTPTAEVRTVPPPGLLGHLVREIPLGAQIAVYGPHQRLTAAVVDSLNAVAYVHKPHQLGYFKKARPRLVSLAEHRRLEHYAQKVVSTYVITLDAEEVPRWFRKFREPRHVWIDVYTSVPDLTGYDYVFYVDVEKIRVERSPDPVTQQEIRLQ